MNVVFFGASVTEQIEGYYKFIKENLQFKNHSFERYAFGGCHLDDAGFFNLDKLKNLNPDVVVFEWNTTARVTYDIEKVKYIFSQLVRMIALPIILIIPHIGNIRENRESERQMIEISRNYDIPLIDIRDEISSKYEINELLRDGVHTNILGAEVIGSIVAKEISNLFNKADFTKSVNLIDSESFDIVNLDFKKNITVVKKEISFSIILNTDKWGLCLYHEIGLFSPIVEIFVNNHFQKKMSFWDPYCHYSRMHYTSLISNIDSIPNISEKFELKLSISKESPDYSKCRRDGVSFDVDREVRARVLYGYGVNLEVKEWK